MYGTAIHHLSGPLRIGGEEIETSLGIGGEGIVTSLAIGGDRIVTILSIPHIYEVFIKYPSTDSFTTLCTVGILVSAINSINRQMKLTLTSLLALCLCLSGCGKNEKPETQAKGENPLTSVVPKAKEAQSKPKSPEPKIAAKDNSKAKTSQPKQGVELTEEEAFKILLDALSGMAFDERNKALYKIEVDDPRSRHSSFNSVRVWNVWESPSNSSCGSR